MQGDPGNPRLGRNAPGVEVGQMVVVDSLAHLDGDRRWVDPTLGGLFLRGAHRSRNQVREQIALPRKRGSPASASHFGDGAPHVEIDVVRTILADQNPDRRSNGVGVYAVELHAARRLIRLK